MPKDNYYPIDPAVLRPLLDLSPLTVARIAEEFGISRVNLFGVLAGRPTLGANRYLQLLRWAGLDAPQQVIDIVEETYLPLLPGLHVWEVKSAKGVKALGQLQYAYAIDRWSIGLVLPPGGLSREWLRFRLELGPTVALLSVRSSVFPLLRERLPELKSPQILWLLTPRYGHLVGQLGEGDHGLVVAPNQLQNITEAQNIPMPGDQESLGDWAAWLRREMQIDTTRLPLPTISFEGEVAAGGLQQSKGQAGDEFDAELYPEACRQAWRLHSDQLDVGQGTHPDICDVPVFELGPVHTHPRSLIRLSRFFLGDDLLALAKDRRLRLYRDDDGSMFLVGMFRAERCAGELPKADDETESVKISETDHGWLGRDGNTNTWHIDNSPSLPHRILEGVVLAKWQPFPSVMNSVV